MVSCTAPTSRSATSISATPVLVERVGRYLALFATATVLVTVRRACTVWRATLHHIALVKVGINLCVCDADGIVHCTEETASEPQRVMLRLVGS